jgi:thiamine biosynthesis protein ThiS
MDITVHFEKDDSTKRIKFAGKTVRQLLLQLKLSPEIVIVTRKNEVLPEEEVLKDKDRIEVLSVVSGG